MIRIGLRDARAHLGRFVMSIIAIALGVSFVVGSFCFRAMMSDQVDQMMGSNSDGDVYVRGSDERRGADSSVASMQSAASSDEKSYNRIDVDLTERIATVPGVESAAVVYSVSGIVLVGSDGNAASTMGGATVALGLEDDTWRSAKLTAGRWSRGKGEIALHSFAAEKAGLSVGDKTKLVYPDGAADVTVVGIFDTASTQAGAIVVGLNPKVARDYFQQQSGEMGTTRYIRVYGSANGGAALSEAQQRTLAARIDKVLPADAHAHAVTGQSIRDDNAKSTKEALGFIQPLILIFAVIALFVGSFIIANTFSMIVRESMRGYALLRSVGASPAQVFSTVIIQAIVLGLIGSVGGIALGWGMVRAIAAGMSSLGMPLSAAADPKPSDMLVGLLVGVVVTLVGAALPARRAALAPPIQAMNETTNPERPVRLRGVVGALMIVLGTCSWALCMRIAKADDAGEAVFGWQWADRLAQAAGTGWTLGAGAALVVVGVIVLAPALVTPTSVVLGWIPTHVFTVTGRLATRNMTRGKRRTANTAAALFVGVAIVSCLSVVASSAKASVAGIVDSGLKSDFSAMSVSDGRIPDDAITAIRKVSGVSSVSQSRMMVGVTFGDGDAAVSAMTFAEQQSLFTRVFAPVSKSGDANRALREGDLVVGSEVAKRNGWKVGDSIRVNGRQVVVDKEATAKAQADMQARTQARIADLQEQARQAMLAGDAAKAQALTQEAVKVGEDAKNIDPATLVKTKNVDTHVSMRVGAVIDNSIYRSMVLMNDDAAARIANDYTMFTIMLFINADHGADSSAGSSAGSDDATADTAALKKRLIDAVKPYYVVNVQDREEFKSTMSTMVDQILIILYALLALSIVIAIFGIVNTLALSVSERTRELGLLRAIGTSRGQIRGMLEIEASLIAVLGTLLGVTTGGIAGVVIQRVYSAKGLEMLAIPWQQLGVALLAAIAVGVIAALPPARRALRVPVLDAIEVE